jgi:hypothetical protein
MASLDVTRARHRKPPHSGRHRLPPVPEDAGSDGGRGRRGGYHRLPARHGVLTFLTRWMPDREATHRRPFIR